MTTKLLMINDDTDNDIDNDNDIDKELRKSDLRK